ncbi:hypothetical protein TNCV_4199931 [Trichonephila clavipes]|uniref:Uncharacterized protein n=1 Tax=Trichonephila clavipes TaxID=2585209 RepID=A0A8X7BIJ2_TRICX|nr:hypothetical protein TNCV_4199931 [Trichonephila clavipes]
MGDRSRDHAGQGQCVSRKVKIRHLSSRRAVSRHVHGHQNTARRTETHLKRRHFTNPVTNFVVLPTSHSPLLCCIAPRRGSNARRAHAAANGDAPYERILHQKCPFPD